MSKTESLSAERGALKYLLSQYVHVQGLCYLLFGWLISVVSLHLTALIALLYSILFILYMHTTSSEVYSQRDEQQIFRFLSR